LKASKPDTKSTSMTKTFTWPAFIASLLLLILSVAVSCGSGNSNRKSMKETDSTVNSKKDSAVATVKKDTIPAAIMTRGDSVYTAYCLACHQVNGSGNPGMYPPLKTNATVVGDKNDLILIVLKGLSGAVEVNGVTYTQAMPPHNFLTDSQIADVLTYVRNSFGNSAEIITPEDVKTVRTEAN